MRGERKEKALTAVRDSNEEASTSRARRPSRTVKCGTSLEWSRSIFVQN